MHLRCLFFEIELAVSFSMVLMAIINKELKANTANLRISIKKPFLQRKFLWKKFQFIWDGNPLTGKFQACLNYKFILLKTMSDNESLLSNHNSGLVKMPYCSAF